MYSINTLPERPEKALTGEWFSKHCDSVMAGHAAGDVSSKYTFVPTYGLIQLMEQEGWFPISANQQRTRKEEYEGLTKHVVRLTHYDNFLKPPQERFDVILTNSHNRTSGVSIMAGYYRLVCSNGMVVGEELCGERIRHSGKTAEDYIGAVFEVVNMADEVQYHADAMKQLQLTDDQRMFFGHKALEFLDVKNKPTASQIIQPRRNVDIGNDIWRTFQVTQENMIKGGIYLGRDEETGRRKTSRRVKDINKDQKINKKLWSLAEEFYAAKEQGLLN